MKTQFKNPTTKIRVNPCNPWIKTKTLILTVLIALFSMTTNYTFAQVPDPPSNHGSDGNQQSGNRAPIGGGLFILLGLGAAYGGIKGYKFYQKKKESLLD